MTKVVRFDFEFPNTVYLDMKGLKPIGDARLFHNILNQFILTGFSYIVPILLIPFLINRIGLEKYGLVNFVLAVSFYFQVFIEFGFDLSNVGLIVPVRDDRNAVSRIVSGILQTKFLLLIVSGLVLGGIVAIVPQFRAHYVLYILAYLRIAGVGLGLTWLFRSMEDMKYITRITLPIKTITTLPIFFLVKGEEDYVWVLVIFMLECVISGGVSIVYAFRRYGLSWVCPSLRDSEAMLRHSWPFFTTTLLTKIYQTTNPVILGLVSGDYYVGVYTAAEKLHNAYASFISPLLAHVLYPYFTRVKSWIKINRIVVVVLLVNLVALVCMYLLAPYLIPYIIKSGGDEILSYFNIFLLLLVISIPNDLLGFPYLGVMGHVGKVNRTTIWASVAYLLLVGGLILTDRVSIVSLIIVLILVSAISLSGRGWYIRKYQSTVSH